MGLAGPRRALHDDAVVVAQPGHDETLFGVGGQREERVAPEGVSTVTVPFREERHALVLLEWLHELGEPKGRLSVRGGQRGDHPVVVGDQRALVPLAEDQGGGEPYLWDIAGLCRHGNPAGPVMSLRIQSPVAPGLQKFLDGVLQGDAFALPGPLPQPVDALWGEPGQVG